MKLHDKLTGRITQLAKDGSGTIKHDHGRSVQVYHTIPGETVEAKITDNTKAVARGKLVAVTEPSSKRVVPRCPYAGTCGGCKWQHVDYHAQVAFKLEGIRKAFKKAGVPCPIERVETNTNIFYYRNRMDYVFGSQGELGLKEPGSWSSILDLSTCFLLSPESVEIMKIVREWTRASGLPFWNGKNYTGFFRYLVIREGKQTGQRLVMLVTAKPTSGPVRAVSPRQCSPELRAVGGPTALPPDLEKPFTKLVHHLDRHASSIVWGINPLVTDLSIAQEIIPLKGEPWIEEEVNGLRYKITPNAFFQTNTLMAEKLQDTVKNFCGDLTDKTLLDLYCGSGFFSLALAPGAKKTVGIELDSEAIACAKENAARNNITADYFVNAAEKFDWANYKPDVVILDPPRAGMHPKLIKTLLEVLPPRIVYVSCNYLRFLEEAKELLAHYNIRKATALDLFPHTPHVECVFQLERKP